MRRLGQGLAVLAAGYLLIGSACLAAEAASAPTAGPTADFVTEKLLRSIVQQISGGRIISPADDNAMQTWQRVTQRDIVTHRSPEVLRALEDFDTYARARAADEQAAGHVTVAAQLIVFANQASRMTGRSPPAEAPATVATAPNPASNAAVRSRSGDGTVAVEAPGEASAAVGAVLKSATVQGEVSLVRSASASEASSGIFPPSSAGNDIASVTDAVLHIASHTQPFGAAPVAVDARPAADEPGSAVATQAPMAAPPASTPEPVLVVAAVAGTATAAAAQPGTPPDVPTAALQPAAPDPAMAAFYAARGDAMLAQKDISAARKFYEFAANAGSARAAAALARTYDPGFAAQPGQVGLRPDPELAASWNRRAEQLRGESAQLSQSGNSGK